MPNRLAQATSPYLRQHADNPVDWHEWGPEAFARARREDKPILLSVGYATCHWCHVMAHESFEDPETARTQNELFVSVKVDREERPDVDRIYMDAVQAMTGRGGWPMTVFLTPDGKPFYAGTYYPKEPRHGMPSFRQVMEGVAEAWRSRREEVEEQAERLTEAVSRSIPATDSRPNQEALEAAYRDLHRRFDPEWGGFGGAPKFPQSPVLEFLLRVAGQPWAPEAETMLVTSLERMAAGGIHDHLGGGFARYSVDARWLVPHFEKMLYDNAQLAHLYLRGWQETGREDFRIVARDTLEYLLADLGLPDGGIASAEDADSEGEEGRFYVWGHEEFLEVAGPEDGPPAAEVLGVTPEGNFEGRSVLHLARAPGQVAEERGLGEEEVRDALARARDRLREARARRVRPERDDKVVTAWNGLALRALAEAGSVLGEERYLEAAVANARFVLSHLRREDGRLLRAWRSGRAAEVPGFCEDYAGYALGLFTLYQATGEPEWYREAARLVEDMAELFHDPVEGGFYATGHDHEDLITRPKELMDNPAPSGNSLAAEALLTLSRYTGEGRWADLAEEVFRHGGQLVDRYPSAVGHLLAVLATEVADPKEVAVVGPPKDPATRALTEVIWERYRPDCVLAVGEPDGVPLLEGRDRRGDRPTAYVCRDFACREPVTDPDALREQLEAS